LETQTKENQAKAKRYLVLLKDDKKATIKKAENELKVALVSSANLNSKNRAFQVMSGKTGIFYKNLNIAVVDEVPVKTMNMAVNNTKSPIIYWEEEKEYRAYDEFDILGKIKNNTIELQQQIQELEELLINKKDDQESNWISNTWGIGAINLSSTNRTGKGVKVCILDTGLYASHPDFNGRSIEGKSFIEGEDWDLDGNGHGTHCSGTAVGNISSDGKRYGIAKDANIVIGKVLSDSGSGSTSGIVDSIDWALELGCKVISMSLGTPVKVGENPSLIFERAGEKAIENGCLVIAAAGNDSSRPNRVRPVSSPANAKSILSVGAVDLSLNVASFSNAGLNSGTGGRVDLVGPGVDVFSSYSSHAPGNKLHRRLNGTSMATPHVAGIAALLWEEFPSVAASEIWLKLEKNAKLLNHLNTKDVGQGMVQVI